MKIEIENKITVGVAGCTVLGTDTFPLEVLSKLWVLRITANHSASYDSVGASPGLCSYCGRTLTTCKKSLESNSIDKIDIVRCYLYLFHFYYTKIIQLILVVRRNRRSRRNEMLAYLPGRHLSSAKNLVLAPLTGKQ